LRKNIAQKSDIGLQASAAMAKGNLVSDDIMTLLIKSELDQVNNAVGDRKRFVDGVLQRCRLNGFKKQNWLLDGFPRTIEQARILDTMLIKNMQPLNLVINLVVPEEVILGRIIGRLIHRRIFSSVFLSCFFFRFEV
jgi:adenylate kinase